MFIIHTTYTIYIYHEYTPETGGIGSLSIEGNLISIYFFNPINK